MTTLDQRFAHFSKILRNAADHRAPLGAANDHYISAVNDGAGVGFAVVQREKLFFPFGEYPHPKGLQRFDRQSGEILASAFTSLGTRSGQLFTPGVPIYRGHPDVPGRPDSDPSAPAIGWVQGIEVANEGVNLAVKWSPEGEAAISSAHFRFYSPNWLLRPVKGGIQPVKLLSIGLTNNPRIPVPAIANDTEPSPLTPERGVLRRAALEAQRARLRLDFPGLAPGGLYDLAWHRAAQSNPALFEK